VTEQDKPLVISDETIDGHLDTIARELITTHNDQYHPGQDCPGEDETGGCHLRSGKPAVTLWTDSGPKTTEYGRQIGF
jgi:hypothetical protein